MKSQVSRSILKVFMLFFLLVFIFLNWLFSGSYREKPTKSVISITFFDTDKPQFDPLHVESFRVIKPPSDLISSSESIGFSIVKGVYIAELNFDDGTKMVCEIDIQGSFLYSKEYGGLKFSDRNIKLMREILENTHSNFIEARRK